MHVHEIPTVNSKPHVRGDEPDQIARLTDHGAVSPTCVGMNR